MLNYNTATTVQILDIKLDQLVPRQLRDLKVNILHKLTNIHGDPGLHAYLTGMTIDIDALLREPREKV